MTLLYKLNKLFLFVTPTERTQYLPYIYGAKLDPTSGLWVAPTGALLTILTVFPEVQYHDKATTELVNRAKEILNSLQAQKNLVANKEEVKNKDYPFLMSHQAVCNNIASIRPRYAFFLDTGTR